MTLVQKPAYSFGVWSIDPNSRILLKEEQPISLTGRAFDVFYQLVSAQGELVTKDDLLESVWQGIVVEENSLQAQISAIRKILGTERKLLVTEFGQGYRFLGKASIKAKQHAAITTPLIAPDKKVLIGRDKELAELSSLISTHSLVTVTGTGGIGKTSLVMALNSSLEERHDGQVRFIELAPIHDERQLNLAVANCLNLNNHIAHASSLDLEMLAQLQGALVLDNCEHIIDDVARMVDVLTGLAPNLKILATSQESLRIADEQVYKLNPLPTPSLAGKTAGGSVATNPAVVLFLTRARAIKYDYEHSEEELSIIAGICSRLDGLPLAIELAASRLASETVSEIYEGIDDRFNSLTTGKRTALPRHRTLFATIDWSYKLLNDEEKLFFSRLSIFAKKFTKSMVIELLSELGLSKWQVSDLLLGLTEKSLLQTEVQGKQTRYLLLESIKCYASERLEEMAEYDKLTFQYAKVCCVEVQRASLESLSLPTQLWQEKYSAMMDDIRFTLDWTLKCEDHFQLGVEILEYSTPFWITLSLYDECRHYIEPLLENGFLLSEQQEMLLYSALGKSLSWSKGPIAKTGQCWRKALALAELHEHQETLLQACYGLWLYYLRSGEIEQSLKFANLMVERAEEFVDQDALETGKRVQGTSLHFLGRHTEAKSVLTQSIGYFSHNETALPYRFGLDQLSAAQAFLSRALWVMGDTITGREMASKGVKRAQQLEHVSSICCALAEGECMVAALDRNYQHVLNQTKLLSDIASRSNLHFWKSYSDLYLVWGRAKDTTRSLDKSFVKEKLVSISESELHWSYTSILAEVWLESGLVEELKMALLVDERFANSYWAAPIFLCLQACFDVKHGDKAQAKKKLNIALQVSDKSASSALFLRALICQYNQQFEGEDKDTLLGEMKSGLALIAQDQNNNDFVEAQQIIANNMR